MNKFKNRIFIFQNMKTETFYKILCGVLLAIVGFIGTQIYLKISEMQKDLIEVKIALTKLQAETLSKADVKEIVISEIYKYHDATHK